MKTSKRRFAYIFIVNISCTRYFFTRTSKFWPRPVVLKFSVAQFEPQFSVQLKLFLFPSCHEFSPQILVYTLVLGTVIKHVRHSFDFLLCF